MTANESGAEKRVVTQLDFTSKTAKRVAWEAWEFSVAGPYQVRVTNAAYGVEKSAHSYVVGIEQWDGLPVPAECECPADVHREPDCKHKVALATVGGRAVLDAATSHEPTSPASSSDGTAGRTTAADVLQTDGGVVAEDFTENENTRCLGGTEWCPGPDAEALPCFSCYRGDDR
ncbi:hypothetical protein CK500_16030 [Halorubrum salipaludis]|uniref:SWIM-type domain-containing protein n=1 Tax=Halorubrum salipaludis TaxID=2032630 RepID=A0A2A2F5C5_9EURY|nr:hypothetical protein CK500_16030 [Halorubrum salipaludis]